MISYVAECTTCGQRGTAAATRRAAKEAFAGHACPTAGARHDPDNVLVLARSAVTTAVRLSPALHGTVAHDDMLSDALYGIALAQRTFDPALGAWRSHAHRRAVGAVLDGLRDRSPVSRSQWSQAVERGEVPSVYRRTQSIAVLAETGWEPADERDGIAELESHERARSLLAVLTPVEREVVVAYVLEGRTGTSLAETMGVTASRVSQIKRNALARMRAALEAEAAA